MFALQDKRVCGALLATLGAAAGCTQMAIEGQVLDAAGQPIEGARVSAFGTPCVGKSGADGRFELTCPPARYDVIISAEGYTDDRFEVDASERKRYEIGKHVLVRIPEEKGLFLFSGESYLSMKPGELTRDLQRDGGLTHRAICLDREHSEANEVRAGVHQLFDYEHPGWRPFKLDPDGCAYRDTENRQHKWTVEYREKAEYETTQVNEGKTIATMTLEPGQYFIADWKGFFVAIEDPDRKHNYSGYWLVVND